jgi:hypothetical protein
MMLKSEDVPQQVNSLGSQQAIVNLRFGVVK